MKFLKPCYTFCNIIGFCGRERTQLFTQIQNLINEYKESTIQSEAEVRSKLIVPLLGILGYPSYLRAEEFPVYGFEGSKRLATKNADFVLFSDKNFAYYREFKKTHIDWVQEHSLLIVEAKKPNEMPDVQGQSQYYTFWTRAVAYLTIDGEFIKGYYYNPVSKDKEIIDCSIENLSSHQEIRFFSYESTLEIKQSFANISNEMLSMLSTGGACAEEVTEEDVKDFPENTLRYMRYALGANATGLSNLQLISRYLHMTDAYLQNDLRYDVPEYMLSIPRKIHCGHLYINDVIIPYDTGNVIEFYRNNTELYQYDSDLYQIAIIVENGVIQYFNIGFHTFEKRVVDRLLDFEKIEKVLFSQSICIELDRQKNSTFTLLTGQLGGQWIYKEKTVSLFNVWRQGLEQLRTIEEFYNISFDLSKTDEEFDWRKMHADVESIYNGIICAENCIIQVSTKRIDEDIIIDETTNFEENIPHALPPKYLFDVTFVSEKSWILPCIIKKRDLASNDIVQIPGCIRFKIEE